jgi:predicted metalloprotease
MVEPKRGWKRSGTRINSRTVITASADTSGMGGAVGEGMIFIVLIIVAFVVWIVWEVSDPDFEDL